MTSEASWLDPTVPVGTIDPAVLTAQLFNPLDIALVKPNSRGIQQVRLTPGVLDQDADEYLGRHYCHWLAAAMATLTGWPHVVVIETVRNGRTIPAHSAALAPGGAMLDVFGTELDATVLEQRYSPTNDEAATSRIVAVENMPGDVFPRRDHRGNRLWWVAAAHDRTGVVFVHFAHLLLQRYGYADHIRRQQTPSSAQTCRAQSRPAASAWLTTKDR